MDGRLAAGHAWKVLDAVGCADAGGKDSAGRRQRQAIRHARESAACGVQRVRLRK